MVHFWKKKKTFFKKQWRGTEQKETVTWKFVAEGRRKLGLLQHVVVASIDLWRFVFAVYWVLSGIHRIIDLTQGYFVVPVLVDVEQKKKGKEKKNRNKK